MPYSVCMVDKGNPFCTLVLALVTCCACCCALQVAAAVPWALELVAPLLHSAAAGPVLLLVSVDRQAAQLWQFQQDTASKNTVVWHAFGCNAAVKKTHYPGQLLL